MLSKLHDFFSLLGFFQSLQHKGEECSADGVIRIQTPRVSLSDRGAGLASMRVCDCAAR